MTVCSPRAAALAVNMPCVPMENTWQLVKGSHALRPPPLPPSPPPKPAGSATSLSAGLNETALAAEAQQRQRAARKAAALRDAERFLASLPHQQVLVLGEGGSGAAMIAQLFARSPHYMLWREPHNWKFAAHMPDEMLAATLAGLYRCELSPQQLSLLHAHAPDYREAMLAEEEEEEASEGGEDGAGPTGQGGKNGYLARRYSMKAVNSTESRFCGPGMATAALVTRFSRGLPATLHQLPSTKIVQLVRNPVDVVVARLQAKWVRGGPAWPACTLRTIELCADELCGSMSMMLRSLPSSAERVRLLRWETFAKRRQRVLADLLSWLGTSVNHSSMAELIVSRMGII